jgi:hypothetical protein
MTSPSGKLREITVSLISDANVVDVKSPVSDLQVLFGGRNIVQESLNLKLFRIQIFRELGRPDLADAIERQLETRLAEGERAPDRWR